MALSTTHHLLSEADAVGLHTLASLRGTWSSPGGFVQYLESVSAS